MKRYTVEVTEPAQRDWREILDYLADEAGTTVAEQYNTALEACLDRLYSRPLIGSPRAELGDDIRVYAVRPYLVICRIDEANVFVMRILHERRNISPDMLLS